MNTIRTVNMISNLRYIHSGYLIFFVLLGPVILVSPSEGNSKDCEEISGGDCLKKLQTFLRLTSLPFTSDKAELDTLCSNVVGGYNCSTEKITLTNCLSPEDKGLFPVFLNMAQYTMLMFCSSGDGQQGYLRDALLENSDCILKQKKALDCCADQSKLPEFPIKHILEESGRSLAERQKAACCPVSNYLKCVRTIVLKNCGETSGNLTTEYIRRASGEQMEEVCQKMPNYPELDEGVCKTRAPVCSGSRTGILVELTVLMSLMFIIWINYV